MRTKKYQVAKWNNRRFIATYICFGLIEVNEIINGKKKYFGDYASFEEFETFIGK